jgi:hypothetical protein
MVGEHAGGNRHFITPPRKTLADRLEVRLPHQTHTTHHDEGDTGEREQESAAPISFRDLRNIFFNR